jgi:phosphoadenosine phosphosulfate reductase
MRPLQERMRADGMTLLLRGQRDSDEPRSPVKNGETVDGFTICYPIAGWSTEEVETYIAVHGWPLPPYYAAGMRSAPDCRHCTGWLEHNPLPYLRQHHPDVADVVTGRLRELRAAVDPHYARLVRATESA